MKRRPRLAAGISVAVALGAAGLPASAQAAGPQRFATYGSGAVLVVDAARNGGTQAFNVKTALAAQVVNSLGLGAPMLTESDIAVQPSRRGANAFARGSGMETGLLTPAPAVVNPNQSVLADVAEAVAPPLGPPVVRQVGPVAFGPIGGARVLRGTAHATYDASVCAGGGQLAAGQGEAGGVQLLGIPNPLTGELLLPLVSLGGGADGRPVSHTLSTASLLANGDGTYGLVSEVRQTIAPVSLLGGLLTVELLGEWTLRATATGKPGGARVESGPVGAGPSTPVARVNGTDVTLQQLLGPSGFVSDLGPLGLVRIAGPTRAAFGQQAPRVAKDGTSASGVVDAAQVRMLDQPGLDLVAADIRIGHMEASAVAPSGGLRCEAALPAAVR